MLARVPSACVLMPDATSPSRSACKGTQSLCSDARRHFPRGRFWQDTLDVGGLGRGSGVALMDGQGEDPYSKGRDQKGVTGTRVLRKVAPSGEARSIRQTSLTGLWSSCRGHRPQTSSSKPAKGAVLPRSCYCTQRVGDTVSPPVLRLQTPPVHHLGTSGYLTSSRAE